MRATCPGYIIVLDLIILAIFTKSTNYGHPDNVILFNCDAVQTNPEEGNSMFIGNAGIY